MFWRVRAVLEDRPGALAALATACATAEVNILGLQFFPTTGERVLDELVLRTPDGWTDGDVAGLCSRAGAEQVAAVPCTAKALEDQPVRYLRAAARILEEPDRLEEQLALLDEGLAASAGGTVVRQAVFTDTEQAREVHLRRVAAIAARLRAPGAGAVEMRPGTLDDLPAVVAFWERCGRPEASPTAAREVLAPTGGESLVLTRGDRVIALGSLAPTEQGFEASIRVEDDEQQRGLGTRLVRGLAMAVAELGASSFSMLVEPESRAVLPLIAAAGLRARAHAEGVLMRYVVPVRPTGPASARDLARMGEVTVPLVDLLARRPELRDAYPTAGFIDAAIRDSA